MLLDQCLTKYANIYDRGISVNGLPVLRMGRVFIDKRECTIPSADRSLVFMYY